MLQTTTPTQTTSIVKSLFAKAGGQLYQVELKYKVNGMFCLRPISGRPYRYLLLKAEQVRALRLFPIFGGAS